jgi:phosphotransferase system HPr (HPr) family protein
MKEITKKIRFSYNEGMHARVAAIIVQKASELRNKYDVEIYLKVNNHGRVPLRTFLLIVSLKIKAGDEIELIAIGKRAEEALELMIRLLQSDFDIKDNEVIHKVDSLLQGNVITSEQIFNSVPNGLIIIDENNIVTIFNNFAQKVFGLDPTYAIGKNINVIFPEIEMELRNSFSSVTGIKYSIRDYTLITSITPIIVEGENRGFVCTFEDITNLVSISWQLKEIKELKEKYQMILESVQDGICVLDEEGIITYINSAYEKIINDNRENMVGKNINNVSPQGYRKEVLVTKKQISHGISKKKSGMQTISNVSPIIVDGELLGVISVVKDITEVQRLSEKLTQVTAKAEYLEEELIRSRKLSPAFDRIIGRSKQMIDTLSIAAKAAKGNYTVLITGESGTGKELVAEAIHYSSKRANESFIRVNCAAIPDSLLESELFGYEKGAFTGALKTKLGRFELANKGTIFLDEIGEMEKSMQAKLLRVLQNKQFERVGGEKTIKSDVRIIAATNQKLEEQVRLGEFREDLSYRLNVIPIKLPPLRERKEDIPILVEHFINRICKELEIDVVGINKSALDLLSNYDWKGNVRELTNVMERTITLLDENYIDVKDLPLYIREESSTMADDALYDIISKEEEVLNWEEYERIIISKALKKYKSFNATGKALGLTHKTVANKARKYGLDI